MKHRPILEIFTRNFSSTACPLIYNKQSDISMLHRADDYGSRAFIATSSVLSAGRICRVRISKLQRFLRRVADLTSVGLTARRTNALPRTTPKALAMARGHTDRHQNRAGGFLRGWCSNHLAASQKRIHADG